MSNKNLKNSDFSLENIPWSSLEAILSQPPYKQGSEKITKSLYEFAANEKNEAKLIEVMQKSLIKNDPKNSSYKQAVIFAKQMQIFARKALNKLDVDKPSE